MQGIFSSLKIRVKIPRYQWLKQKPLWSHAKELKCSYAANSRTAATTIVKWSLLLEGQMKINVGPLVRGS